MEEFFLLPRELHIKSLSKQEVVLPYDEALQAIDIFLSRKWAVFAWEGWIKYPDGRCGHSAHHQGTGVSTQKEGESRESFIQRAANFCRQTIVISQKNWQKCPEIAGGVLHYCLSVNPNEGLHIDSLISALSQYPNGTIVYVKFTDGLFVKGSLDTIYETDNGLEPNEEGYSEYYAAALEVIEVSGPNSANIEIGSLIEISLQESIEQVALENSTPIWGNP